MQIPCYDLTQATKIITKAMANIQEQMKQAANNLSKGTKHTYFYLKVMEYFETYLVKISIKMTQMKEMRSVKES